MDNFTKEQLVPDVINVLPNSLLKVTWDGKDLEPGAVWTPTQVQNQPQIGWDAEDGTFYTLILSDPDAPSRADPKSRECLHWLVTNIPGSDIEKGDRYAEYIGSGAPKDTGLHRYCFLVFKQPGKINIDFEKTDKHSIKSRRHFRAQAFADKYGLGNPEAGNFFLAEYDDYCPVLHAQLGLK